MVLKSFHFDCGNSTDGPIGFCARIRANTKEEALAILKRVLPDEIKIRANWSNDDQGRKDAEAVEYIEAYIGANRITVKNIDDWEDVKE